MAFRFEGANCIALGTFNMYIVQPAWLTERKILPDGLQLTIGSKLDEPGFRYSSPGLGVRWIVAPNRIEVSTKNRDEDCGLLVAKVLESLPWTPLKALGNNAIYKAPFSELPTIKGLNDFCTEPPEGVSIERRSIHVALKQEPHVFNLRFSVTSEGIELSANAHTELREMGSDSACQAAGKFLEHRQLMEELVTEAFNVSIEYDESDSFPEQESD